MTQLVAYKLLAIFATVALGWVAARRQWLGAPGGDPARVLSDAAFTIFVPALLFRTMVRIDLAAVPWPVIAAYFAPAVVFLLAIYLWQRRAAATLGAAAPATRAITASYGNGVQLGIPIAAALFGESGLALHVALVSVHGLILLTLLTVLVETDLARQDRQATLGATLRSSVRNSVIHPVTLPVLAGLAWNLGGIGLHPLVDQTLAGLAGASVPLCLVLIGVSLATYGLSGQWRTAVMLGACKLLLMPAFVLAVAHGGFGLAGTPLTVLVMMAALPSGANSLLFAQRYGVLQGEATTAIVLTTVAFVATASLWLALLGQLGP